MAEKYRQWLGELTALPTAAGREDAVIDWVQRWARRRRSCRLTADRFGNLLLQRTGRRRGKRSNRPAPILFTAHMDHPAFVVREVTGDRRIAAEFRGGVARSYFVGSPVLLHHAGRRPQRGIVRSYKKRAGPAVDPCVQITFSRRVEAAVGDIVTWDTGPLRVRGDLIHTPACDDLAGAAAALAAFDQLSAARARGKDARASGPDVSVLLTRCEEVGFTGAIGACESGIMPTNARLIALENSKSFAESPSGAGPIVRVGDRASTFDPDLTYRICRVADRLQARDATFKWQRKLMPGGMCEASAFQVYGYTATCLCLPLGNYHNMNEKTGRIDAEFISLSDFDGLVRLLVAIARWLDDAEHIPSLRSRLDAVFARRRALIE